MFLKDLVCESEREVNKKWKGSDGEVKEMWRGGKRLVKGK